MHLNPSFDQPYQNFGRKWQPGFWKRLPAIALSSLTIAVLCAIAVAAVLASSNNVEINQWPSKNNTFQPTVALAVLATANHLAMRYTLTEGIKYVWWKEALQGATLKKLHETWVHGMSIIEASRGWKSFNVVSLASIITSVACIATPLLQHATSISTKTMTRDITISTPSSDHSFPSGYSGWNMVGETSSSLVNYQFARIVQHFTRKDEIRLENNGCGGTCETSLIGSGFDVSCSTTTSDYDFATVAGDADTQEFNAGHIIFAFNSTQDSSTINFSSSYKSDPSCTGTLETTTCSLRAAKVAYPLLLANETATLLPAGPSDTISLYTLAPEPLNLSNATSSTLGGFALALSQLFASNITLRHSPSPVGWTLLATGPFATTHILPHSSSASPDCTLAWKSPVPDILAAVRELAFRSAIATSPLSARQDVTASETRTVTVYVSHFNYLIGALVVMLVDAAAVFPLFVGWWRLGRKVSMSPIEVAKAFGAPLLREAGSNEEVAGLVTCVGEKRVRYGAIGGEREFRQGSGSPSVHGSSNDGREKWKVGGSGSAGVLFRRTDSGTADQEAMFAGMQDVSGIFGMEERLRRLAFGCEDEMEQPQKGSLYK